ncbi:MULTISPECIES: citrate synthase [Paenibacillus]|uniref:Citrate synthase n=1 Tax=Paenibacillus naphthalenovorans TaxID=162209 RepID=A0A0U2VTL1_9BACL|nr:MULTISPECIES: citrate synthase [Paenibacillus]ALS22855.1 citrate synthase [Paenibacillus naphthalenovorans]NTZ17542.1 citrate synthase [Paenibacillus sp. JMULE4]GCL70648.1 citrate synthase 3 [Paenibacillus naphthalenovorans]SDH75965.1 citrate synthase [Paenibacillus naphthalenovorans]
MTVQYQPGLENVIASETSISYLDVENEEIVLRGYDLIELARKVTYLDVVGLLLNRQLPTPVQRNALEEKLKSEYSFPEDVLSILKLLPQKTNLMDVLRTGISAISGYDEELEDRSRDANYRKSIRLLAKVPQIVANGYRAVTKQPLLEPRKDLSYSANFLYMITGTVPTKLEERVFDQSLIVYSEHEMPNSTFAARVIASTQSDIYGALTGAVASLKGTLHGGANEAVMKMLLEAGTESQIEPLLLNQLSRKERIMGFGHRVYMKKVDPRAMLMKEALAELVQEKDKHELFNICVIGENVMKREKGLYPNLDYYAAPVYYLLGIPIDLFTPVFLAARTIGICAHVMEQHENNRLFRPRVFYNGPRGLHPQN